MNDTVKLCNLLARLSDFEYPLARPTAVAAGDGVTLDLADGTEDLGRVLSRSSEDTFASADELLSEVMALLPRHAVGEPYQSEGDA